MPISLAKVRDREVQAKLVLESEAVFGSEKPELLVTYRPGVLTPAFEAELREFGENSDGWARLVSTLVSSWDFLEEDGNPVPLEFERLRTVPGPFLAVVVAAIRKDIAPNPPIAEGSGDGSSPEDLSATSPTTTHSFERPGMEASPRSS